MDKIASISAENPDAILPPLTLKTASQSLKDLKRRDIMDL